MTNLELEKGTARTGSRPEIDALHVPATGHSTSSAWFDVYAISAQRSVVTVGAVSGGVARATAITRAVRAALPDGCQVGELGALLRIADAIFGAAEDAADAGSGLIGIIDRDQETFTYVSAGDAAPLLRYADGVVVALPSVGRPIGQVARDYPTAEVVADIAGVTLIALASREIAPAILADERIVDCAAPAAWIARRLRAKADDADVAVVAVRGNPTASARRRRSDAATRPHWSASLAFDATGPASTGARHAFTAYLAAKDNGGQAVDVAASELIFGELLGNVVRHAPGPVEITLDWNDAAPVLHVLDNGTGFQSRRARERLPDDDWSESGRGLFIVNACATAFSVQARPGHGTHASATLPLM